jgi:lipopolysaccharide transport system ATP-binding protein
MKPIIRVENLSKQYRIGAKQASYATLRESLTNLATAPFRRFRNNPQSAIRNPQSDMIWALKDVSFEVQPGEVVGIIGRNGAGKSTLLKILSRITEPTIGRVDLYGRVGSLLEVGTGFHPELTGRENIYLSGAILGMSRAEIDRKFEEIVDFAEIEKFLDTPAKHYSSGMYMRLAFAVAAHLEPEILVVDEVLAVGDIAFQKKCLGKMESVAAQGRTVLFVSHSMPVVRQLCSRGVLLRQGEVARIGRIEEVIDDYLDDVQIEDEVRFNAPKDADAYFSRFCICDIQGNKTTRIPHTESFFAEIEYVVRNPISYSRLSWMLSRSDGVEIMGSGEVDSLHNKRDVREPGRYITRIRFPGGILNEGRYQYRVAFESSSGGHFYDYKHGNYFEIYDDTDYGAFNSGGRRNGVILLRLDWNERSVR